MKFRITRTSSNYFYEKRPCEKAVKGTYLYTHTRTCTEEEFNRKFADREGLWRSKGINHRVNSRGYIQREDERKGFLIEINTLEELVAFVDEVGDIIISKDNPMPEIEIYDDYRE
ncbi:hypothetical protein EOM86_04805 [Candidatus Nomurabacteria bacterium]|nr:hypothetical protein [Candidatus Nomurabacteria bacterium]